MSRPLKEALQDETQRKLREARARIHHLEQLLERAERELGVLRAVHASQPQVPRWLVTHDRGSHRATALVGLSDLHLDEVVRPAEVGGMNAYDRRIAGLRLQRAFERAVVLGRDLIGGWEYDGCCLLLGGDLISGDIHDELEQTNEATVVETTLHWTEPIAAGIKLLAEAYGRVHVVGVVGNHGRRQRRPRYKRRATDNWDWLLMRSVARLLASDERVTWQVPQSLYADVRIYDMSLRLEHGDEARGGTGIAGALSPLLLLQHRRLKQYRRGLDLLVVGHWHRRLVLPGLLAIGTLKGPDEYTLGRGFDTEPPSQEFAIVAPGHGIVLNAPIYVASPKEEAWHRV